jgi:mono/diheme cytochrome c family protein
MPMKTKILLLSLILSSTLLIHSAVAETPADIYKAKCAMCHAADGSGNTPAGKAMKARDFHDADVIKATDADLTQAITKGRNKMPAYGTQLSPDQIKGLVAYIRAMQKSGK